MGYFGHIAPKIHGYKILTFLSRTTFFVVFILSLEGAMKLKSSPLCSF